jgi:hypothetical protein
VFFLGFLVIKYRFWVGWGGGGGGVNVARFLYWVLACSPKCEGCLNFFT